MSVSPASRLRYLGHAFWLIGTLAVILVVSLPVLLALQADSEAKRRDERVVANGLASFTETIAKMGVAETAWDESVRQIDNKFDRKFAHETFGKHYYETYGFDAVIVLSADGSVLYAAKNGEARPGDTMVDFKLAAAEHISVLRQREYPPDQVALRAAAGLTMSDPLISFGIHNIANTPYVITVQLIQPDMGEAALTGERAPIVIAAERIEPHMLAAFGQQFLLSEITIERGDALPKDGRGMAALLDTRGEPVAAIHWSPPRPGTRMLWRSLPPTLIILAAILAFAAAIQRMNQRTTHSLIASEARASHLAYHDVLTGLPNRLLLTERLERALAEIRQDGATFCVHMIDLDGFKEINDTYGHGAGDEVIKHVARTLLTLSKPGDTLARLGGDEFAFVQAGADEAAASVLATAIIEQAALPIDISAGRVFIGASVGVALAETGEITAQDCLRRADLALYDAKGSGRGRFSFYRQDLDETMRQRRDMREELRAALATGALTLVYQPQFRMNRVTSVEALLRWNHPVRGQISPTVFIPIAEESGLIEPLGYFTLRRAFEDSHRLPGLDVAVNVSAAQLRLPSFVGRVEQLLKETGADPARFEIEITEGLLLGDDPMIQRRLEAIRALGLRIALDDFGTGYSSLSYLQRYPINKIKIDRSFVTNLGVENEATAVVSAIIRLARALNLDVVAEGVETEAQRVHLLAAGCGQFQGFLFGHAVSLEDIERQLARDTRTLPDARQTA